MLSKGCFDEAMLVGVEIETLHEVFDVDESVSEVDAVSTSELSDKYSL